MSEAPQAAAAPQTEEVVDRNPREELAVAMKACTYKQRKWLRALPEHNYQRWRTGLALGISRRAIQKFIRDPRVVKCLELIDEVAIGDLEITNRRILGEYAAIAFSDLRGVFDADGKLLTPGGWSEEIAAAIAEVHTEEHTEGRGEDKEYFVVRKVKVHSKLEALKALSNYQKLIVERHEVTGADGEPLTAPAPIVNVIIDKPPGAKTA